MVKGAFTFTADTLIATEFKKKVGDRKFSTMLEWLMRQYLLQPNETEKKPIPPIQNQEKNEKEVQEYKDYLVKEAEKKD